MPLPEASPLKILMFDIETNGLLQPQVKDGKTIPAMDRVHCIVTRSAEGVVEKWHGDSLRAGLDSLSEADWLIGHNALGFDIPALKSIYPDFKPTALVRDTLTISRLIWPELKDADFSRMRRGGTFPARFAGKHSLEAWGHRLGVYKGDFAKDTDWQTFTPAMLDYCTQDTLVLAHLWEKICSQKYSDRAIVLEQHFAQIMAKQERRGFGFNKPAAEQLCIRLQKRIVDIDADLLTMVEPFVNHYVTPKKKIAKTKIVPFNPNSRDHVARHLMERRGWVPLRLTEGEGKPQVDETALEGLEWPEAKLLLERFMVAKTLGQLADGKVAWLKLVGPDGRIHGRVNTNGAVTGRCTHSGPNITQVPANGKPYGRDCRSLFQPRPGFVLVGADASGLELRCLAHFMARYDGGAYVKVLLEGDVHSVNQAAAGLATRDQAKTFIYAFLYGAGPEKIGSIIGKGASAGKLLINQFLAKTPALARLKKDVVDAVRHRGHLIGLDGRRLAVRSQHAATNTLLQSAGAVVMKKATVNLEMEATAIWVEDEHFGQVAHAHDEIQTEARPDIAPFFGALAVKAIRDAGTDFNFRCPLDGAFKIGASWADTH